MKQFFLRHWKLHSWLLGTAAVVLFFHIGKHNRHLMNALAEYVTEPLKRTLGALCDAVPFSVAEVLIVVAVQVGIFYLCVLVIDLFRREDKKDLLYRRLLGFACAGISIYAGFCILWGVNYYIDGFQEKSGIHAKGVSVEQLTEVTELFAQKVNAYSVNVQRTEEGLFAVPREEIYQAAPTIYDNLEQQYPFLEMEDHMPKRISFSKVMSAANFTGFFFPFTGEANLNDDCPAALLPATIAHEMAHQRSIASEQECNFIAILVCETSGNAAYAYSGALFAYIHLSNALYRADRAAWEEIRDSLHHDVQMDLAYNNAYWRQYEGKTAEVSQKTYDQFLKGYGEERGIQSYGEVVDLLVGYYSMAEVHS